MPILNIESLQAKIKTGVESLEIGGEPTNLYEPINYIMSLGGKRLRPLLTLLSYQLGGGDPSGIVKEALTVEVFHNFTLMHDDIMDKAPLRRGQQTVHEKWNDTVAILSGDTMLVKAYDLLLDIKTDILSDVLRRFNKTAVEVCEGQQIDMDFENMSDVSEAQYLEMIRLKTAVLLGFSMEFGGMLAGFDKDQNQQLFTIGEKMGVGFQLMDDILDVYADKAKFGKQVGGDIISNKKTYLLIKAQELANPKQKQELERWISAESFDAREKVKAVTLLYDEIGIPELAKTKMNAYFDESMQLFDSFSASEEAKSMIRLFANQLMKREK
jgi:geranylgeranyl diphosphate synthase type II